MRSCRTVWIIHSQYVRMSIVIGLKYDFLCFCWYSDSDDPIFTNSSNRVIVKSEETVNDLTVVTPMPSL